jgi:magnesium transporter
MRAMVETPAPPEEVAPLSAEDLHDAWRLLSTEERLEGFRLLPRAEAEDFFFTLSPADQCDIVLALPPPDRRSWMRLLAPDDAADVIQAAEGDERDSLLGLLDEPARKEVSALLAYAEDEAGGLMSPRYARVRPSVTVDEAISYLRRQARERIELLYYAYVIDADQRLVGIVSFRDLFAAAPNKTVADVMTRDLVTCNADTDQEALSHLFAQHDLLAIPVIDEDGRMKGVVTVDDIVDVVEEEATEDIQKMGGTAALEEPYLDTTFFTMVKKRAGWLMILFVSQMLTTSAMSAYEVELQQAVVLALFIPLLISSGGNSGSQACTLIIRAMALGEVRLRDWFRVIRREIASGFTLGVVLGLLGFLRVALWPGREVLYTEHYLLVGMTVGLSVVGIVTWGTISGSMLPFILRRIGFDPASASAPFVATVVDVSGVILYLTLATHILRGTLL